MTLQFNAWTSPWLPLIQNTGSTLWASPVEVLCGEKDGLELDYPRDDFRAFARLLLSALVQAVVPAKDKAQLAERLKKPMKRAELEQALEPVLGAFELFGKHPFLLIQPPEDQPKEGAAPFVFPAADLFPTPVKPEALSLPIALLTVFIEHTYAGGAGRGYGAGPGGQPGAFTLITPPSIREGAWANSLSSAYAATLYSKDGKSPWAPHTGPARNRAAIGLVSGLLFQPRSIWLTPAENGPCSFSGVIGPRVIVSPLRPGTAALTKKAKGDLWQHPCSPLAVNSQDIAPVRLKADRPAWTGLAQLLKPVSRQGGKNPEHPREGPAPVLTQWRTLTSRAKSPKLLVLDYNRDKANVKGRFFENFPLTDDLLEKPDLIDRLRGLVGDAEEVGRHLSSELTAAHDTRKKGGFAKADALASYWSSTEAPFVDWLALLTKTDAATNFELVEQAEAQMRSALRKTAVALFDRHAELSEFDPAKQKLIAAARRRLKRKLWPQDQQPKPSTPPTTGAQE